MTKRKETSKVTSKIPMNQDNYSKKLNQMNGQSEYQHQQSSSLTKFNNDLNFDFDEAESPSPLTGTKQSTLKLKLQGYRND